MKAIDLTERTGQIVEMARVDFARSEAWILPMPNGTSWERCLWNRGVSMARGDRRGRGVRCGMGRCGSCAPEPPWKDLPDRYPPYQTCHRRFQKWQKDGRFEVILQVLAEDVVQREKLDLSEGAIDACFAGAKKGALQLVKQSAAKGPRSWQLQTAMVFLSPCTWPALRHMKPDWWKLR